MKSVCEALEKRVAALGAAACNRVSPVVAKLEPQSEQFWGYFFWFRDVLLDCMFCPGMLGLVLQQIILPGDQGGKVIKRFNLVTCYNVL